MPCPLEFTRLCPDSSTTEVGNAPNDGTGTSVRSAYHGLRLSWSGRMDWHGLASLGSASTQAGKPNERHFSPVLPATQTPLQCLHQHCTETGCWAPSRRRRTQNRTAKGPGLLKGWCVSACAPAGAGRLAGDWRWCGSGEPRVCLEMIQDIRASFILPRRHEGLCTVVARCTMKSLRCESRRTLKRPVVAAKNNGMNGDSVNWSEARHVTRLAWMLLRSSSPALQSRLAMNPDRHPCIFSARLGLLEQTRDLELPCLS